MDEVLQVRGVRHRYGGVEALAGVDLTVRPGECVALLGPNGAGKTTLVGLVTGLMATQSGAVRIGQVNERHSRHDLSIESAVRTVGDPRRAATRRHIGVVAQSTGFPSTLTVAELVRGAAVRAGRAGSAATPVLAEVGIAELAGRRAVKLSGGQRQRVALAMALAGDPDLLVLDEPTVGLDVEARRAFRRTLAARRDRGAGVLLTTHLVEEAGAVADRVVVLHHGHVVAADTPDALTARLPDRTVSARTALSEAALLALPGVLSVRREGASERVRVATTVPEDLLRAWLAADARLTDLRVEGAGLEEALVSLTGRDEKVAA